MSEHPNLALARELICCFAESENDLTNATENDPLMALLDAGGETDIKPLPGDTTAEICNTLKTVLQLASYRVPLPVSGRNREARQWSSQMQRERIKLFARVCLALLGGDETGGILPGAI